MIKVIKQEEDMQSKKIYFDLKGWRNIPQNEPIFNLKGWRNIPQN